MSLKKYKKMKKILFFILIISAFTANAQVAVNTDGSNAASSAIVDIKSSNKGFLPPRLSKGKRDSISHPAEGLVIYDTTYKTVDFYNGEKWISIGKSGIYAKDSSLFQLAIGSDSAERANDILYTPDGGFLLTGCTGRASSNNNTDMLMIKLNDKGYFDVYGNNSVIYYSGDYKQGTKLIHCNESGFLMTANWKDENGYDKTSSYRLTANRQINGSLGGITEYDNNNSSHYIKVFSVVQLSNDYYCYAGQCDTVQNENWPDAYLFLTDSAGEPTGNSFYIGRSGDDAFKDVINTTDGKILAVGYSHSNDNSSSAVIAVELNSDLSLHTAFGNNGIFSFGDDNTYTFVNSVIKTNDGGFLLAGETDAFGAGGYDALIIKLQANGQLDKNFGTNGVMTIGGSDNEIINKIIETKDGNYVLAGYSYQSSWWGTYPSDMYIAKITFGGNRYSGFGYNGAGAVCIGGSSEDRAYSIIETTNGCLVAAGYTESFGNGGEDMVVVKLDPFGNGCANTKSAGTTVGTGTGGQVTGLATGNHRVYGSSYSSAYTFPGSVSISRICH